MLTEEFTELGAFIEVSMFDMLLLLKLLLKLVCTEDTEFKLLDGDTDAAGEVACIVNCEP